MFYSGASGGYGGCPKCEPYAICSDCERAGEYREALFNQAFAIDRLRAMRPHRELVAKKMARLRELWGDRGRDAALRAARLVFECLDTDEQVEVVNRL